MELKQQQSKLAARIFKCLITFDVDKYVKLMRETETLLPPESMLERVAQTRMSRLILEGSHPAPISEEIQAIAHNWLHFHAAQRPGALKPIRAAVLNYNYITFPPYQTCNISGCQNQTLYFTCDKCVDKLRQLIYQATDPEGGNRRLAQERNYARDLARNNRRVTERKRQRKNHV